jgi:beta-barrel assembly-enhancing protease
VSGGFPARLFDGCSAVARAVRVETTADGLALAGDDGTSIETWGYAGLERHEGPDGTTLGRDDARLIVADPAFGAALRRAAPRLYPRPVRRAALFGLPLALAALVWAGWEDATWIAARLVPLHVEDTIRDAMFGGVRACATSERPGPLADLTRALTGHRAFPAPVSVWVVEDPAVNAFALPGGRILLFEGLLKKAHSADEVAAVLAHELAHVEARDPIRLVVARSGLAALTALTFGDTRGGQFGSALLMNAHTRSAERRADARAVAFLTEAGLRADGLSRFLNAFAADPDSNRVGAYLQDHPLTADRVEWLHPLETAQGRPALDPAAFERLRNACSGPVPPQPGGSNVLSL